MFPRARIAALDAHETQTGRDVSTGTNLTRTIAHAAKLNLRVHVGASPFDVAEVLIHEGMASSSGGIDIAFIDGAHTDAQQYADYAAVRPHMRRGAGLVLLHDVTLTRMYRSIHAIEMDDRATSHAETRGVVHPWVGQKLLKCNEIKSLIVRPR